MVLGAVRRRGCSEQQPFGAGTVQAGAGAERLPRARFLEQLRQERGPCVAGRQHCACEKDRGLLPGIRPDQPAAGKGRRASSGDNKTSMLLLKPESAARPSQTSIKRMKRFELSTLSLARRCSTTELHPHGALKAPGDCDWCRFLRRPCRRPHHHALSGAPDGSPWSQWPQVRLRDATIGRAPFRSGAASAPFEQQALAVVLLEAEPLIEARAVGGHQIHPLRLVHLSIGEQLRDEAAAQALAPQRFRHHHIPEHGPEDAITGRTAEAHQL